MPINHLMQMQACRPYSQLEATLPVLFKHFGITPRDWVNTGLVDLIIRNRCPPALHAVLNNVYDPGAVDAEAVTRWLILAADEVYHCKLHTCSVQHI
jgi:hypothetical protein